MRPTLRQLEILVAIADGGSIAAAATRLGVDGSSVSRAVGELERVVGDQLVARRRDGAPLTSSGERVLASARQAIQLVDGLDETARGAVRGRVTIGAFRSGAAFLLPPALARLRRQHPGVDVAIVAIREADGGVGSAVASGRCDIGLTSLPTLSELAAVPLTEDPYVRVEPVRPAAGPGALPFIHWDEDCSRRGLAWLTANGMAPEARMDVEDDEVVLACVAQGLGWSLMPALATRPQRPHVRLRALDDGPSRTIGACFRHDALQRPPVLAVVRALEQISA